jgi:hypothetical protein
LPPAVRWAILPSPMSEALPTKTFAIRRIFGMMPLF